MNWFYSVSHHVLTPNASGSLPRPAHEEILENEQARDDHTIDVLLISQNIIRITYKGVIPEFCLDISKF